MVSAIARELFGAPGRLTGMHVRMLRIVSAAALVAVLAAGCGSSTSTGSGAGSTHQTKGTLSGSVVIASDTQTGKGAREPNVTVGLYLAPIHAGGPIAADPPRPVMQVQTDRNGTFRFNGLQPGKRYFVFASGAKGYTIGRWAKAGENVRLTVCTTCVMPL
jgi:hypothetical protein